MQSIAIAGAIDIRRQAVLKQAEVDFISISIGRVRIVDHDLEIGNYNGIANGTFREDLYYRLNVVTIRIPPLRERKEDIPLLARHFIRRLAQKMGMKASDISERALGMLIDREWPGNVRELENAIERAMATCVSDRLEEKCFEFLTGATGRARGAVPTDLSLTEMEKLMIPGVLDRTNGNVAEAARILGIDRSTLYEKMKRYGIERPGKPGGAK